MARRLRKKNNVEEDNHERWLVSYADFVTLLFAFFVVMYSISSVNNTKYASLSEALDNAFSKEQYVEKEITLIQIGEQPTTINPIILENLSTKEVEKQRQLSEEILKERHQLQMVSEQFEDVLQPYIENDLIEVKRNDFWIELEMNSQVLFLSGEAELSTKAIPVLKKVAEVVSVLPNVINIEGYTDNVPINTVEFPSNWDLSSARATSVVRQFIQNGISPSRLSAIGYGEFHPVADNTNEQGRLKNRRVILVLMSQAFARYGMTDKKRAEVLNFSTVDRRSRQAMSGKNP
jgi:chemotaxis protein MotB